jgi:hypothetical protein
MENELSFYQLAFGGIAAVLVSVLAGGMACCVVFVVSFFIQKLINLIPVKNEEMVYSDSAHNNEDVSLVCCKEESKATDDMPVL